VFAAGLSRAPGERIIVARNPSVFEFAYGAGHNLAPAGFTPRNLSNGGEQVQLAGPLGEVLQDFNYGTTSPWPSGADGGGASLEIIDPLSDAADPSNWRASLYAGGSPGASGLPGDYDGNGIVDELDRLRWRSSFGASVARGTGADGNRDGHVDAADFVVWRKNEGTAGAAAATSVESAFTQKTITASAPADGPGDMALPALHTWDANVRPTFRPSSTGARNVWDSIQRTEFAGRSTLLLTTLNASAESNSSDERDTKTDQSAKKDVQKLAPRALWNETVAERAGTADAIHFAALDAAWEQLADE